MCRLYGFRSNEPTKVECTLVLSQNGLLTQSRRDVRGLSHPDGWGIAVYDDHLPQVERRATAAFEDIRFSVTAERIFGHTVAAHVRAATVGGPAINNTHPFVRGCWVFAHNGTVRKFPAIRDRLAPDIRPDLLASRKGTTDSEFVFYWLLDRLLKEQVGTEDGCTDLDGLARLVSDSVVELDALCREAGAEKDAKLNFLLTDGQVVVASRLRNTLSWVARDGIRDCEICGIPHVHHDSGRHYRAAVVASEPLSDEAWEPLDDWDVIAIDAEVQARVYSREGLAVK